MSKRCPTCRVEMKQLEVRGVTVDRCPECLGIWLDKGELEKIVEKRKNFYERIEKEWPPPISGDVPSEPLYDEELEAIIGED